MTVVVEMVTLPGEFVAVTPLNVGIALLRTTSFSSTVPVAETPVTVKLLSAVVVTSSSALVAKTPVTEVVASATTVTSPTDPVALTSSSSKTLVVWVVRSPAADVPTTPVGTIFASATIVTSSPTTATASVIISANTQRILRCCCPQM